jgi:hypothetical protein
VQDKKIEELSVQLKAAHDTDKQLLMIAQLTDWGNTLEAEVRQLEARVSEQSLEASKQIERHEHVVGTLGEQLSATIASLRWRMAGHLVTSTLRANKFRKVRPSGLLHDCYTAATRLSPPPVPQGEVVVATTATTTRHSPEFHRVRYRGYTATTTRHSPEFHRVRYRGYTATTTRHSPEFHRVRYRGYTATTRHSATYHSAAYSCCLLKGRGCQELEFSQVPICCAQQCTIQ